MEPYTVAGGLVEFFAELIDKSQPHHKRPKLKMMQIQSVD